jgi:hypothetical protein
MSEPLFTDEQRKHLAEHRDERIQQYLVEARKAVEQLYQAAEKLAEPTVPKKSADKN